MCLPVASTGRRAPSESEPHRELLEFVDATHVCFGCPSLREMGSRMRLSYGRVHDIIRGVSLPVSEGPPTRSSSP